MRKIVKQYNRVMRQGGSCEDASPYTIIQCANIVWQTVTTKSGHPDWQEGRCSRYLKEDQAQKDRPNYYTRRRWSKQGDEVYCPQCSGLSREMQEPRINGEKEE